MTDRTTKLSDLEVEDLLHKLVFELEGKEGQTAVGDAALQACRLILLNMLAALIVRDKGR